MIDIKKSSRGLIFTVSVIPRSSRAAIVGSHGDALKIKLTAPPVGGAANKQCILLLAKALAWPKSALAIVSGQTRRLKQLCILTEELQASADDLQALKEKLNRLGEKTAQTP